MDFEQAKRDIINWITGFVERPNEKLNGWSPCPYARQARLQGQLDIRPGIVDPYVDFESTSLENFSVIVYVYNAQEISADQFEDMVRKANEDFLLDRDLLALADHPDSPEVVNEVCFNQGEYALAFLQSLGQLNEFAGLIAIKGYYDGWPEDYLQALFEFREDPRS